MPRYRTDLPQLSGDIFLADGGVETDLIFNHGIEIREFAAHTLLPTPEGRAALTQYFEAFLRLAKEMDTGFILDTVTWKAHAYWGRALGASSAELRAANEDGHSGSPRPLCRKSKLDRVERSNRTARRRL